MTYAGMGVDKVSGCGTCAGCLTREFSLFDQLSPEELEIVNEGRTKVHYNAGEPIFKEGTRSFGLLCLSNGKVKISINSVSGSELIVALKRSVDFLGFEDFIAEKSYSISAHAIEDSEICVIKRDNFFEVAKGSNSLLHKINVNIVNELTNTRLRMAGITQKHMRGRLADALLYVKRTYGFSTTDDSIGAELKRSDIAALSNMTTANSIRTLSDFAKEDLISIDKRKIFITPLQLDKLYTMSLQV